MKYLICAAITAAAAGSVVAGEVQFKPIDTNKLVVQPSKAAADLSSQTIKLVGNVTAGQVEGNGYVKTINNLFGFKRSTGYPVQPGRSPLPQPTIYQSTQYKNYNTPMMPIAAPIRR